MDDFWTQATGNAAETARGNGSPRLRSHAVERGTGNAPSRRREMIQVARNDPMREGHRKEAAEGKPVDAEVDRLGDDIAKLAA
jgi:hypothetical protein